MPAPRLAGLRILHRRRRVYVYTVDVADLLRVRARAYRRRADDLTEAAVDPAAPEHVDGLTPALDEALACRMVAEELEQRADHIARLGR